MIAHVAEASELSGRVVLWLDPESRCPPALLEAPVRLAAAYDAEIETIVVADENASADDLPLGRVDIAASPELGDISIGSRRFELLARRCRRAVEDAGSMRGVKVRHALASGDAVDRVAEMCIARGPWNIVALTRVPAFAGHSVISGLLANVSGATGFLLCCEKPRAETSRIVVIVEDAERLPAMLRAAERLLEQDGAIHLVIGADTAADYADIEAQARLAVTDAKAVKFANAGPTFGVPGALTETVARLKPSLVFARFGGSALADGRELARASAVMRAPILLVR
jgi:hypothetical protein